ncbi:hypothetical protein GCM10023184_17680 [Flaviaesturariibacter amylovorans]|uniref:Uncharacterized protein n=1 Tax=Flaviaesturariibacter amylovorans TaxID=1084520 RepID=A0ABP8GPK3_9BACT
MVNCIPGLHYIGKGSRFVLHHADNFVGWDCCRRGGYLGLSGAGYGKGDKE